MRMIGPNSKLPPLFRIEAKDAGKGNLRLTLHGPGLKDDGRSIVVTTPGPIAKFFGAMESKRICEALLKLDNIAYLTYSKNQPKEAENGNTVQAG